MKKILSILMTIALSMSLFVGCSSPTMDYKNEVERLELAEAMETLVGLVDDFYKAIAALDDEEDLDFDADSKEDFLASIEASPSMKVASDISDQIVAIDGIVEALDVDLSVDEVAEIHRSFEASLEAYKDLDAFLVEAKETQFEMYDIMYDLYQSIDGLFGIAAANFMTMSATFQSAFTDQDSVMMELFGMFTDGTLDAMLDSKEIDEALLNMLKASVEEAKVGIEAMMAENESDETMKQALIDLGNQLIDFADVMIDNKDLIKTIEDTESFMQYLDEAQKDAKDDFDAWQDMLNDI